jgi:Predicted integral membrane protein
MNYNIKKEWPLLVVLALPFIGAILLYPHLPQQVPIHWDIHGNVDNYGSKFFGTFFLPLLNVLMYVLFIILPKIDPKRANYNKFNSSYQIIRYTLHLFFLLMFAVTAAASLGYPIPIGKWIPAGVSVLFIVMGNFMGRIRHNYFVGFKLPWTLANEDVWRKTHQFGGKLMVIGGAAALLGVIFTKETVSFVIMTAGIFIPIVITTIYSYIIYSKTIKK